MNLFRTNGGGYKLVWTNPTPNVAFNEQTLQLALNYKYILIETYLIGSITDREQALTFQIEKGKNGRIMWSGYDSRTGLMQAYCREVSFLENGNITIKNSYNTISLQTPTLDNGYGIPIKIYATNKSLG